MLTVITPADTFDLTTLATVKDELGITNDADDVKLAGMIKQASNVIADHCRRVFGQETVEQTFYNDRLQQEMLLSRYPVVSIASITENNTALSAEEYNFNCANGLVTRLYGHRPCWWPTGKVVFTYTAGYRLMGDLPFGVERACIELVKRYYFSRRRDTSIRQDAVEGVGSVSYWTDSDADGFPPSVFGLLGPQRNKVVA